MSGDFSDGVYSFNLQPGEQNVTVSIPIFDDNIQEQLEMFLVSMSVQPKDGLNIGNSEAFVNIRDDDSKLSLS